MIPQDEASQRILDHYTRYDESRRLTDAFGKLELERTKELILRYVPATSAVIYDIGGGVGPYAFWLAELGHQVHLVDLVPRHIDEAGERQNQSAVRLASLSVADARNLTFGDITADLVILHGPLYHFIDPVHRAKCLTEANRVLRPGGVLLAFGVTRYAGAIFGIAKGLIFEPEYLEMIRREVKSGVRLNPPESLNTFSEAYFHLPDELRSEVEAAGFRHEASLGVVGPAWLVPDLEQAWGDTQKRGVLLAVSRLLERESVLGPRILSVGRKVIDH